MTPLTLPALVEALRRFAAEAWLPWAGATTARTLVVLTVGALILLSMRRACATARHLALVLMLLSVLLLPLLAAFLPPVAVPLPAVVLRPVPLREKSPPRDRAPAPVSATDLAPPVAAAPLDAPFAFDPRDGAVAALFVWIAGVCSILVSYVAAHVALRRRARPSQRVCADELREAADQAALTIGVRRPVRLLLGEDQDPPMAWGWRHPFLLLPRAATAWPNERLRAVLLHEMAHIARGDGPVGVLAHVTCALHWPNPLVWVIAQRMRRTAEHACDDRVLLVGVAPADYADALVAAARDLRHGRAATGAAVAMASRPPLVAARVRAILEASRPRRGPSAATMALAMLATVSFVVPAAVLRAAAPVLPAEQAVRSAEAVEAPADQKVMLPGGVTVELTRVGGLLADGSLHFWRPDGSTIPTDEVRRYRRASGSGAHLPREGGERYVYARITTPTGAPLAGFRWEDPPRGYIDGGKSGGAGMPHGWDTYLGRRYPPSTRRAAVRLAVATGGWQTVATAAPGRPGKSVFGPAKSPVILEIRRGTGGYRFDAGLRVNMTGPAVFARDDVYAVRLTAVGSGREESVLRQTSFTGGTAGQGRSVYVYAGYYSFLRHPADHREKVPSVREVRLEVSRYHWVTFRDVPLEPAAVRTDLPALPGDACRQRLELLELLFPRVADQSAPSPGGRSLAGPVSRPACEGGNAIGSVERTFVPRPGVTLSAVPRPRKNTGEACYHGEQGGPPPVRASRHGRLT